MSEPKVYSGASVVVSILDPNTGERRVLKGIKSVNYTSPSSVDWGEMYDCAGCKKSLPGMDFHHFETPGRSRPVTSRCKACRREAYYESRYPDICGCCVKHRPLQPNGVCRTCNEESGVALCRSCNKVLPLFLSFFGRSRVCKNCKGSK